MYQLTAILFAGLAATATPAKRIAIVGDSITEGFGVKQEQSYPMLVQQKARKAGKTWFVINSGISGSTSAGAARVQDHFKPKADVIVLALGVNDALQGTKLKTIEDNLSAAIEACKKAGVTVILTGFRAPRSRNLIYDQEFEKLYPRLAEKHSVTLIPFLLEGVNGHPDLMLEDDLHPNAKGHAVAAEMVFQALKKALP